MQQGIKIPNKFKEAKIGEKKWKKFLCFNLGFNLEDDKIRNENEIRK